MTLSISNTPLDLAAARAIRARKGEGLLYDEEIAWLAEQARTRKRIVEIGSWCGCSARAMADNTSGEVYCVDVWNNPRVGKKRCIELFKENTKDCANIHMLRLPSLQAAVELAHLNFDMIFIDADHSYEAVKADILAWRPLLREGGLLCGHDFDNRCNPADETVKSDTSLCPGVDQAVAELIPDYKLGPGCIWYKP